MARLLGEILTWVVLGLMVALTCVVVVAVIFRYSGASLSWYDEIAGVLLAWITYYGAALAALHRSHIGFDDVLLALPHKARAVAVIVAEGLVLFFFGLMAWAGLEVLDILQGETLVALDWVPVSITQSVIPIGAILFIIAELLSLPFYWFDVMHGKSSEHAVMAHGETPTHGPSAAENSR
ncbi:C4-dicarboxylate ABC transporter permease [Acuticoccus sediminis]|uniref:TRAP transporter small permease protein n=1 Tax=Acuticoccus sediminis TaxID=2184697 RepID=A0A8B2NXX3_9HYPH|nr:TRAP transporter small permease [Acuticoccus sediminis]RAI02394.1 C4-dicarboxylate ABC transporter permease [Acuticoccus sediminis]